MTKIEFNNLNTDKKAELVWEWGYYVTQKKQENDNIIIFSLGNFLAQAKYNMPENKLECIKGINSDELNPELFLSIGKNNPFIKLVRSVDAKNTIQINLKNKNSVSDNIYKV